MRLYCVTFYDQDSIARYDVPCTKSAVLTLLNGFTGDFQAM